MTLYDAVGGRPVLEALAHAWHQRCLDDPVASHPFSHGGHPQHLERLAAYWTEQLGGPPDYTRDLGDQTQVVRLHAGNGEHHVLDERAIACFARALDDVGIEDGAVRAQLERWFRWGTTEMLAAYPESPDDVPGDLDLPVWPSPEVGHA